MEKCTCEEDAKLIIEEAIEAMNDELFREYIEDKDWLRGSFCPIHGITDWDVKMLYQSTLDK
jgi:hypothetical protein